VAIRLYHLASEFNVRGSELLATLRARGLEFPSVMTILDDEAAERARQVAEGKVEIRKPAPGKAT